MTLAMAETEQSISLAGMPPLHDVEVEESDEALPGDQADSGDGWDTDLEVDGEWTRLGWALNERGFLSDTLVLNIDLNVQELTVLVKISQMIFTCVVLKTGNSGMLK